MVEETTTPKESEKKKEPKGDTDSKDDKKDTDAGKENPTELEKLKEHNDAVEKELVRGRELKAEAQKLEADAMVAGTSGGHIEDEKVDPDQDMADKLLADTE